MCCGLFCKEFKGWCQSFTRTERALTILETVLLVVLVGFLIFLILHLLACSMHKQYYDASEKKNETEEAEVPEESESQYEQTETPGPTDALVKKAPTTVDDQFPPLLYTDEHIKIRPTTGKGVKESQTTKINNTRQTIDPDMDCTWTPSAKTEALTHYYENNATSTTKETFPKDGHTKKTKKTTKRPMLLDPKLELDVDFILADQSDGEDAESLQKKHVVSLVKLKPPQAVIFGCILTIIDKHWMLTSASCIEAIEEVDSLDSFVIMEDYGTSSNGKIHSIIDLQIHPFYQGKNKSYDLAMIKSDSSLINWQTVELPTVLDYSMITIGERFHVLGFGPYRSIDGSASGRSLRQVQVYRLPARQCPGSELWSTRHLEAGRAVPGGAGGAGGTLCAGALYARGLPCNYCSGTPLLQGRLLLGLMSDNQQCGVACEPQLYVNVAAVTDWIYSVLTGE